MAPMTNSTTIEEILSLVIQPDHTLLTTLTRYRAILFYSIFICWLLCGAVIGFITALSMSVGTIVVQFLIDLTHKSEKKFEDDGFLEGVIDCEKMAAPFTCIYLPGREATPKKRLKLL